MICLSNGYGRLIGPFVIFLTVLSHSSLLAQSPNMGFPHSDGFSPKEYEAGTQNWRVDLSDDGRIFFANNDGLLVFDGYDWDLYPLPKKSILRSIKYHQDTIFVGGQDELGYFSEDSIGHLEYHSLWQAIPDTFDIADIWDVTLSDGKVIFRNSRHVFAPVNGHYQPIRQSQNATFLESTDSLLFNNDITQGLRIRSTPGVQSTAIWEKAPSDVVSCLLFQDGWLVFSETEGIYQVSFDGKSERLASNAQPYFIQNQINSAIPLERGGYAVATKLGGILLLDENGQFLYRIDKERGLQDNHVTDLIEDEAGNIWAATFFGVNRIRLNTGLFTFYPDGRSQGAIYDVLKWKGKWWFASSNGLFYMDDVSSSDPNLDTQARLVPGTEGQVWGLDIIAGELFLAHHKGAFKVNEDYSLQNLGIGEGAWKFVMLPSGQICVGGYTGVYVFGANLQLLHKVPGFEESSRIMMIDLKGDVWVSHPYRGLFRLRFDQSGKINEIKSYTSDSGFECELGNYITSIDAVPLVTNSCGVYVYSFQLEKFISDPRFDELLLPEDQIRRIFQSEYGIWFISDQQTCRVDFSSDTIHSKYCISHIGKEYVGGFENLYVIDSQKVILCATRGIRVFNGRNINIDRNLETYIRAFKINDNKVIDVSPGVRTLLSSTERHLHLEFGTKGFIHQDLKSYEYKLEGFDEEWKTTDLPFVDFNNLEAGDYILHVKPNMQGGIQGTTSKIEFTIQEKWYKTAWAQGILALCVFGAFFMSWFFQKRVYERDTSSLIRDKEKTEDELEEVKAQRLEDELQHKNQELTSVTLHLVQKQQTLTSVKAKIEELQKKVKDPEARKEIKRLNALFKNNDRLEEDWERFSHLFNQVHVDFIERLKQKYPHLKPKDRKLCAFLRMNLTTKEIAPLLNISVRGVEISRYRLRKKLHLETKENLTDVVASI